MNWKGDWERRKLLLELSKMLGVAPLYPVFHHGNPPPSQEPFSKSSRLFLNGEKANGNLIMVFLSGGWDSHYSVDPVYGTRGESGNFASLFNLTDPKAPTSKPNLIVGQGFENSLDAFARANTAFVNGISIEIPAHDTGREYIYTGKQALGSTNRYAALPAMLGNSLGGFPSHVVIGSRIPLGDTARSAPPLLAGSPVSLNNIIAGPGQGMSALTMDKAAKVIARMNDAYFEGIQASSKESLANWKAAQTDLDQFYLKGFVDALKIREATKEAYAIESESDLEAYFASASLILGSGLSQVVTIEVGGFDTHSATENRQLPLQQRVSRSLNQLILDLIEKADPIAPDKRLIDTTTVLVTSEFNRTPKLNDQSGTDHARTVSAILVGKGVQDNKVIGGTSSTGEALGWDGTQTVPLTETSKKNPTDLVHSILKNFGLNAKAQELGGSGLEGLFDV